MRTKTYNKIQEEISQSEDQLSEPSLQVFTARMKAYSDCNFLDDFLQKLYSNKRILYTGDNEEFAQNLLENIDKRTKGLNDLGKIDFALDRRIKSNKYNFEKARRN